MLLWTTIAALTIGSLIAAFWPAFAVREKQASDPESVEFDHDIAVYKDQLSELERETRHATISPAEAEQARVEIARRLLAAQDKRELALANGQADRDRRFSSRVLGAVALILIPGLSLLVYSSLGSPTLETQPLAARIQAIKDAELAATDANEQLRQLVARAETHLKDNPDDGRGWAVLAPVYFRLGDGPKAGDAYRNAIRILGESATRLSGLGEVGVAMAGGVVTDETEALFSRATQLDAADGRAMFYLGLAQAQTGNADAAAAGWKKIVDNEDIEANWRVVAAQSISRLANASSEDLPQTANQDRSTTGPDQAAIEAAGDMSTEDRQAMISGMVEQLDARLLEGGGTMEEWQRLIRARIVLNQSDEAQNALERARRAFAGQNAELAEIEEFAKLIGVGMEAPQSQ